MKLLPPSWVQSGHVPSEFHMRQRFQFLIPIFATTWVLSSACDAEKSAPEAQSAAKPEANGEAKPEAKAEKTEAEKQAEARKKFGEALGRAEAAHKKELARWTDEVKAKVGELVKQEFKTTEAALAVILKSPHRGPENVARDVHRHPAETLAFVGITPEMTVVEVGPGKGWYTEILAPLLAAKGKLIITDFDPNGPDHEGMTFLGKRTAMFLARSPELYGKVERQVQANFKDFKLGVDASVDMVFMARNLHGWQNGGSLTKNLKEVHRVLKPGGIAAVIQHRAAKGANPEESCKKGYLPEAWLIEQISAAGFELIEKSELNANPKDTKDYEEGVWTLPPVLTLKDKDQNKYTAIGESDRMTLKFRKKA